MLLLLGLLSLPVSCSLASGPHSVFVDPTALNEAMAGHAGHAARQVAPSSSEGRSGDGGGVAGYPATVDEMPSPVTLLSVVIVTAPVTGLGELPQPATVRPLFHAPPIERSSPPEAPPPRRSA